MRGMPCTQFQSQGVLQQESTANFWSNKKRKGVTSIEPTSVLDKRRSLSPPTSSSTLSSSLGSSGGGGGASSDSAAGAPELHPVPPGLDAGPEKCVEDWEAMLSDSGIAAATNGGGQDQSFLRWIMGDNIDESGGNGSSFGLIDPAFGLDPIVGAPPLQCNNNSFQSLSTLPLSNLPLPPLSLPNPPPVFLQETADEKPLLFNPNLILNHHQQLPPSQNPSFFLPVPQFATQIETHHPHYPDPAGNNSGGGLFLRRNQLHNPNFPNPNAAAVSAKLKGGGNDEVASQQQQALVDQLFKAAELVEARNSVGARGILARLNHQLPSHPVIGKPLFRSAFYFKEALLLLTGCNDHPNTPLATPLDVLLKLGTYKAFSEISPIVQFTNFTSIQAILEELNGCNRIHIVDFDVGVGGHWSSFMQELAHRRGGTAPSLKITAFVSHSSHHPLELHLTKENLTHFATELNIPFDFNVLSLDAFDPSQLLAMSSADEAIAVNFPIGSAGLSYQSIPTMLRLIKQLNPEIVVSVEHGCDRSDLSFSHHFLHAFQACTILLDSIDALGANQDVANKIERFLVQPRIENAVLGSHRAVEKMVPWRVLFASAGFAPLQFSNFTETQAECLLKRVQVLLYPKEMMEKGSLMKSDVFWGNNNPGEELTYLRPNRKRSLPTPIEIISRATEATRKCYGESINLNEKADLPPDDDIWEHKKMKPERDHLCRSEQEGNIRGGLSSKAHPSSSSFVSHSFDMEAVPENPSIDESCLFPVKLGPVTDTLHNEVIQSSDGEGPVDIPNLELALGAKKKDVLPPASSNIGDDMAASLSLSLAFHSTEKEPKNFTSI